MTLLLCGSRNRAGWNFQDPIARTIYNGGGAARIADYGAQAAGIDLRHLDRGNLAIFRATSAFHLFD